MFDLRAEVYVTDFEIYCKIRILTLLIRNLRDVKNPVTIF